MLISKHLMPDSGCLVEILEIIRVAGHSKKSTEIGITAMTYNYFLLFRDF